MGTWFSDNARTLEYIHYTPILVPWKKRLRPYSNLLLQEVYRNKLKQ